LVWNLFPQKGIMWLWEGWTVTKGNTTEWLLAELESGDDQATVDAAGSLFAMGEYGSPAGTYLLKGGQAAFRLGRFADSAVLLLQGLHVAQPQTPTWMMLLVCRTVTCAHGGRYPDAIESGTQFLANVDMFPDVAAWIPHAHHALGMAYDRRGQYAEAVPHHRAALDYDTYDHDTRAIAAADLAYSLSRSGNPDEASHVLSQVMDVADQHARFVVHGTSAIVRCCQGLYEECIAEGKAAESLVSGNEAHWAAALADVRYWMARAFWATGDGYSASANGLWAATTAHRYWQDQLCRDATDLLAEIRAEGGI
jgi:tetratricopeptide (TPR) repeat protein